MVDLLGKDRLLELFNKTHLEKEEEDEILFPGLDSCFEQSSTRDIHWFKKKQQ